jgi:hypothetical protein
MDKLMRPTFYVKSFEEDFVTKRVVGDRKVAYQTLEDIVRTKRLKPNTKSFRQPARLSTTILHANYLKTYRPQGLIFETEERPDYVLPFDLVLLSQAKKIIAHHHRIKDALHLHYRPPLVGGFEKFAFRDFAAMIRRFPSPSKAWTVVNAFRRRHGLPALPQRKFRLAEYNEAVFNRAIKVRPVAVFGYRPAARQLARKLGLPHARTAREFFARARTNRAII